MKRNILLLALLSAALADTGGLEIIASSSPPATAEAVQSSTRHKNPPHKKVRYKGGAQPCLPNGIKSDDIVSTQLVGSNPSGAVLKKVTVKQTLDKLKARCQNARLVDVNGREVAFYRLTGCWGNPPRNYIEILERQRKEIEKLKEQYTVIEMTCDPDGLGIRLQ